MLKKKKYLSDFIKEEISSKTGFDLKKIILKESIKTNKNKEHLDQHIFTYENQTYILDEQGLKKI